MENEIILRFELTFGQINKLAEIISRNLEISDIILLNGDLGTGKTFFVQKICSFLDKDIKITSPTFGLYNIYNVRDFSIWHYDLYRLRFDEVANELENLDFDYAISSNVVMIEWSEKLGFDLDGLSIKFFYVDDIEDKREIGIKFKKNSKWEKIFMNLDLY